MTKQSRLLGTLAGLAVAVIIGLSCMAAWQRLPAIIGDYVLNPPFHPRGRLAFTAEAWADAAPGQRGSMVKALLADHSDLRGRSRAEVMALLGKPDKDAPALLLYGLSDERGGDGSCLWALIIWFREKETVEEVAVKYMGD